MVREPQAMPKKVRKPRTNAQAAEYWAESILEDAPRSIEVNSVIVRGDTIYSFGSHFPMGRICRDSEGRAYRVVVNADHYTGASGFANTGQDQWNVKLAAQAAVERAGWKIKLESIYLSGYSLTNGVPVLPRESDPEPAAHWSYEIPRLFRNPGDPGPEPVKSSEGCVAGTVEEYSFAHEVYIWDYRTDERQPGDWHVRWSGGSGSEVVERWANGVIAYDAERYGWQRERALRADYPDRTIDVNQCPHCARFDRVHDTWKNRYEGPDYGRTADGRTRGQGYRVYCEMVERFGSEEEWREARRQDGKRIHAGRKARREWVERNHIPLDHVSRDGHGVPILVNGRYAMRKDGEAFFKRRRALERESRARDRRTAKAVRERQAFERWQQSMKRKRAKRMRFEDAAREVAISLSNLNSRLESADA